MDVDPAVIYVVQVAASGEAGRIGGIDHGGVCVVVPVPAGLRRSAEDVDAAVALIKDCPVLLSGGGVELGELTLINRGTRLLVKDQI